MDHGGEAFIGFVVACGDAAECLDVAEEVFDKVAPAVDLEIARDGLCAIGFGRDDRDRAAIVQQGGQPIDVEGFVGQERPKMETVDDRLDADAIVPLAGHEDEADQIAERVDQRQDFGRQTAARSADGLILSPPLAPVPCWWTRTMVPSIITYSKSGSPDKIGRASCRERV